VCSRRWKRRTEVGYAEDVLFFVCHDGGYDEKAWERRDRIRRAIPSWGMWKMQSSEVESR
jgi:hypothetical protein